MLRSLYLWASPARSCARSGRDCLGTTASPSPSRELPCTCRRNPARRVLPRCRCHGSSASRLDHTRRCRGGIRLAWRRASSTRPSRRTPRSGRRRRRAVALSGVCPLYLLLAPRGSKKLRSTIQILPHSIRTKLLVEDGDLTVEDERRCRRRSGACAV